MQHGFHRALICETQLLSRNFDLFHAYNGGAQVDVGILDFSTASNTIPHCHLMKKFSHYGVTVEVHTWIEEFLHNRTQRVIVDGVQSEQVAVESVVLQRRVLSPLVFLCFINDIPSEVSFRICLFTYDCLLYRIIKSNQDYISPQHDLTSLEQWTSKWVMHFNAKKCYILTVTKQPNPAPFFYQLSNSASRSP